MGKLKLPGAWNAICSFPQTYMRSLHPPYKQTMTRDHGNLFSQTQKQWTSNKKSVQPQNTNTQTRATYTTFLRVKKNMCCSGASATLNSSVLKRGPNHLHRTVRLGLMDNRGGSGWAFWPSNRLILRQPSHSTLELKIATWIKIAAHALGCPLH